MFTIYSNFSLFISCFASTIQQSSHIRSSWPQNLSGTCERHYRTRRDQNLNNHREIANRFLGRTFNRLNVMITISS